MYFLKSCSSEWQLYADKGFPGLSGDKFQSVFLNSEVDESGLSRKAHNLEATGSNPVFANKRARRRLTSKVRFFHLPTREVWQMVCQHGFQAVTPSLSLFPRHTINGDYMSVKHDNLEKINGRKWKGNQLYYKKDASGTKRQAIIKNCQQCSEEFLARKHQEKRKERKFCSLSCSGKASRQKIDQTGENNPAWKGKRQYVEEIKEKSECAAEKTEILVFASTTRTQTIKKKL